MTNKKIISLALGAFVLGILGTVSVYTLGVNKDSGNSDSQNSGRKENASVAASASPQILASASPSTATQTSTTSDEETVQSIAKATVVAPVSPSLSVVSTKTNGLQGDYAVVTVVAGDGRYADSYTYALKKVNGLWVVVESGKAIGSDFGQPDSQSDGLVSRYGFSSQFLRSLQR